MRQRVSENHGFEVPMVGSDTMYKQHSEDNTCLPADAGADERAGSRLLEFGTEYGSSQKWCRMGQISCVKWCMMGQISWIKWCMVGQISWVKWWMMGQISWVYNQCMASTISILTLPYLLGETESLWACQECSDVHYY